jgi:hypothetical protein
MNEVQEKTQRASPLGSEIYSLGLLVASPAVRPIVFADLRLQVVEKLNQAVNQSAAAADDV